MVKCHPPTHRIPPKHAADAQSTGRIPEQIVRELARVVGAVLGLRGCAERAWAD
jgi:hypothetical protein